MSFGGLILTNAGRNGIAAAVSEKQPLKFTKIQLGDGTYKGSYLSKKELTNKVMELPVTSVVRKENEVIISCDWTSRQAPEGFYLREIGIIGNDVLCYYDNAGDGDAEYIDPESEALVKQKRFRFTISVADDVEITTVIGSGLYALAEEVERSLADILESLASVAFSGSYDDLSDQPTARDLGLGDVDNTADTDKPVSKAQQKAMDDHNVSATAHKDIRNLIDELKKSVSDGKSAVASAITDMGVSTASDAAFSAISDNIRKIKAGLTRSGAKITAKINGNNAIDLTVPSSTVTKSGSWNGATYTAKMAHTEGYVEAGNETKSTTLTSKSATNITPGTSKQTAVSSGSRLYFSGALTVDSLGGNAAATDVLDGYTFSSDTVGRAVSGKIIDARRYNCIFTGCNMNFSGIRSDGSNYFALQHAERISFATFGLACSASTGSAPAVTNDAGLDCPYIYVPGVNHVHCYRSSYSIDTTNYKYMIVRLRGATVNTADSTAFRGHVGLIPTAAASSTSGEGSGNCVTFSAYSFSNLVSAGDTWKDPIVFNLANINQKVNFQISTVHAGRVYLLSVIFVGKGWI